MKALLEIIGGIVLLVCIFWGTKRLAEVIGKGLTSEAPKQEKENE